MSDDVTSLAAPPPGGDAPALSDPQIRYMFEGQTEPVGEISDIAETTDAWGFRGRDWMGTLWLSKEFAEYKLGPAHDASGSIHRLHGASCFGAQFFDYPDLGPRARGWAIYFWRDATRTTICGWVPADRETDLTRWIGHLNAVICARLAAPKYLTSGNPVVDVLRSAGVKVPDPGNVDAFVDWIEATGRGDAPHDARAPRAATADSVVRGPHEAAPTLSDSSLMRDEDELRYEQGHEYAPDAAWGLQVLTLARTGRYRYEQRRAGRLIRTGAGDVGAGRAEPVFADLTRSTFPDVPPHQFPPGATIVTIALGSRRQAVLNRWFGHQLDGYREALAALESLVSEARLAAEGAAEPARAP